MPNEMTAEEAAEMCDSIADGYEFDQQGKSDYHDKWIKKLRFAASVLRRVASGELVPVVHAHWEKVSDDLLDVGDALYCSNCGIPQQKKSNCCPNCRALMDGKDGASDA